MYHSYGNSISLQILCAFAKVINKICSIFNFILRDEYMNTNPEFQIDMVDGFFQYSLTLPMMVNVECRYITGNPRVSKKAAKSNACLKAIIKLHEMGEIDDRLRAIHTEKNNDHSHFYKGIPEISDIEKVKNDRSYPTSKPACFMEFMKNDIAFKLCTVFVDSQRYHFGILSAKSMPPINFTIDYENDQSCFIEILEMEVFDVSKSEELEMLKTYHHQLMITFLRNLVFDYVQDYGYYTFPVIFDGKIPMIDWKQIKEVCKFVKFPEISNFLVI